MPTTFDRSFYGVRTHTTWSVISSGRVEAMTNSHFASSVRLGDEPMTDIQVSGSSNRDPPLMAM